MIHRPFGGVAATTLAAVLALGSAATAQAEILDSGNWNDEPYTDFFDDCGFPVEVQGLSSG